VGQLSNSDSSSSAASSPSARDTTPQIELDFDDLLPPGPPESVSSTTSRRASPKFDHDLVYQPTNGLVRELWQDKFQPDLSNIEEVSHTCAEHQNDSVLDDDTDENGYNIDPYLDESELQVGDHTRTGIESTGDQDDNHTSWQHTRSALTECVEGQVAHLSLSKAVIAFPTPNSGSKSSPKINASLLDRLRAIATREKKKWVDICSTASITVSTITHKYNNLRASERAALSTLSVAEGFLRQSHEKQKAIEAFLQSYQHFSQDPLAMKSFLPTPVSSLSLGSDRDSVSPSAAAAPSPLLIPSHLPPWMQSVIVQASTIAQQFSQGVRDLASAAEAVTTCQRDRDNAFRRLDDVRTALQATARDEQAAQAALQEALHVSQRIEAYFDDSLRTWPFPPIDSL